MADVSIRKLTKDYGRVRAVDELTFEAPSGEVTGFLGPNGAGKTTTLRILLGLVGPTGGEALIGGRTYARLSRPMRTVGAVLDSTTVTPGRSGRDHLRVLAQAGGASPGRVDEVLEQVGLTDDSGRRIGGYSTGMRQRLGLAAALLGAPEVLVLDEPANGLDPEGIAWLRNLLRAIAASGRTVVISSHVLSEVTQTVDRVVIIDRGRLRFAGPLRDLGDGTVSVSTGQVEQLSKVLGARGYQVRPTGASSLDVRGATAEEIGRLAAAERIALSGLIDASASLESAFLRLTSGNDAPAEIAAVK